MELSQKIVIARKKKGLTQEQLADRTNITVRTIQRIESGESTPRSYTLKAIADVLGIPFDTLITAEPEPAKDTDKTMELTGPSTEENSKHFLQVLCLSCFTYLVIPFVHFLVPDYLLKRSGEQNPKIVAFARRMVRVQLCWKSALWLIMLLTLGYNIIVAVYFDRAWLLNYLLPFFIMYLLNALIITYSLLRISRTDFSFQPSA